MVTINNLFKLILISSYMSEEESLENSTRREFLRYIFRGGIRTLGIISIVGSLYYFHYRKSQKKISEDTEIFDKEPEQGNLRVKHFARDIYDAAINASPPDLRSIALLGAGGWFTSDSIAGYLLRNYPILTNRKIGVISSLVGRTLDLGSTLECIQYMQDSRFYEYGLDSYFMESNLIISRHPSNSRFFLWEVLDQQ